MIGGAFSDLLILQLNESLQDALGVEADHHHAGFFHGFGSFVGLADIEGAVVEDGGYFGNGAGVGKDGKSVDLECLKL